MRPDLVCVGDVMVDVAVTADALRRGGDVPGEVRVRPGGAATNAAVWAASTGASVRLHGRVGDDVPGRLLRDGLVERGVEPVLVVDPQERTGTMLVVHEAGERSMVAERGANAGLSPDDLPERLEASAVLVSGYIVMHPPSEAAALAALDRAVAEIVAVDAASWPLIEDYGSDRFLGSVRSANLLLANEAEAGVLADADDPEVAAQDLSTACGAAAVKRADRGAILVWGNRVVRAAAPAVRAADPTGAGDAFDGVLLAFLARGASPEDALDEACRAGARCAASADLWPDP